MKIDNIVRKSWGTDRTYYTIMHRKKHERRCYTFGYRTEDLETLRGIAKEEAEEGLCTCVKIVNANTNEEIQCFTKAHR